MSGQLADATKQAWWLLSHRPLLPPLPPFRTRTAHPFIGGESFVLSLASPRWSLAYLYLFISFLLALPAIFRSPCRSPHTPPTIRSHPSWVHAPAPHGPSRFICRSPSPPPLTLPHQLDSAFIADLNV